VGGGHAIVELDVYKNNTYSYILDPTLMAGGLWTAGGDLPNIFAGEMHPPVEASSMGGGSVGILYTKVDHINRVWRPK
jgi:hypothetical protein